MQARRSMPVRLQEAWGFTNPYRQDELIFRKYASKHINDENLLESLNAADHLTVMGAMKHYREAENVIYNVHTLLTELKSCSIRRDLQWGKRIHAKALESQHDTNMYVASALIRMYAKCGSMMDARRIFDSIQKPHLVSWNVLILGYADNGNGICALDLFSRMKESGCAPDSLTYVAVLKACTSLAVGSQKGDWLERGKDIHSEIGFHLNLYVQNALVHMYAKCGSMIYARRVFDGTQNPDVVSWNALILGYSENGECGTALDLFSRMKARGCAPDSVTYVAVLKSCTYLAVNSDNSQKGEWLERGKAIHFEIGHHLDRYVQSALIDMYAKCGRMGDARQVFDRIHRPDVVCWTALLLGYAENGKGLAALELFSKMKECGCMPNSVTHVAALKSCTSLALDANDGRKKDFLEQGRQIHLAIGRHSDVFVQSALIDMYAKYGSMGEACCVFDSVQKPDVVCWTNLIMGYAENGKGVIALELFSRMKASGCIPDSVTYVAALKACPSLAATDSGMGVCLERGKKIHEEIGFHLNHYLQSTLIDMYAKCGSMLDARRVFDSVQSPDIVCWNALLLGYAENGDGFASLELLSSMKAGACAPNSLTYIAALKSCALTGALALGRKFHLEVSHFTAPIVTCLVDFYAKCGSTAEAREVFDMHSRLRDVTTWNAMLAGYASFDSCSVFSLFGAMQDQGFQPDAVTFLCMLSCCSHAGLVGKAREYFEAMPVQYGVTPTVMHYTCMVDVLGRANQLNEAIAVLQKMPCNPNPVTWMTLLGACRKWKNVEVGKWAFQSLVAMDKTNASAHVLMANIYGSRGTWEEQERVNLEAWKLLGQSYATDEIGNTVKFVVGEEDPPGVKDKLEEIIEEMKALGYYDAAEADGEKEVVCGHSELRAVVYGMLRTPPDEPVRAFKDMRMCVECHGSIKMVSKICGRVIMVRDSSRFHVMNDNRCSCGDYW